MENVSNFKFDTRTDMMAFLKGLKPKDHFRIAKDHGLKPSTKEEANLLTDYLVQGANNGLTGDALIQYAKDRAARLVAIMPHLAGSNAIPATDAPVAPDARAEADQGADEARPVEPPTVSDAPEAPVKATKAPTTRTRKVSKVKHPDGTIVPRPDRGGFEVWVLGKAEAFRPTVEKCVSFMAKKYPDIKTVILE